MTRNIINRDQTRQHGVVSLLTSILVALLLIVITVSGIGLMNSELRQATDFDQSTKAYFAAESGLEDAIDAIRDDTAAIAAGTFQDTSGCGPITPGEANLGTNVSYTCQTVTIRQTEVAGELKKESNTQIDLAGVPENYGFIKISWNQEGTTDPSGWNPQTIPATFPPGDTNEWVDTYPAIMETSFIAYRKGAFSNNSSDIKEKTVFFKPTVGTAVGSTVTIQSGQSSQAPQPIGCAQQSNSGEYECSVLVNVDSFATTNNSSNSYNFVINLHARYSSAHYKVEAFQGSTPVNIPGSQIVIDVTGRAGDVFRRIQAKGFIGQSSILPFAVLSDQDICKVLTVTGGNTASTTGC